MTIYINVWNHFDLPRGRGLESRKRYDAHEDVVPDGENFSSIGFWI